MADGKQPNTVAGAWVKSGTMSLSLKRKLESMLAGLESQQKQIDELRAELAALKKTKAKTTKEETDK